MSKRGFTLIELLAVIVILAIIAIISTPIILGVINESRLKATEDKAWGTMKAVQLKYTEGMKKDEVGALPYDVHFNGTANTRGVKMGGSLPEQGIVNMDADGIITATCLKFDDFYCSTNDTGTKMDCKKEKKCSLSGEMAADDLKNNIVTKGDGLYKDTYEALRYIYRGTNPNNYITFNSEVWRIVAIESDNTIKIIKDEMLPSKMSFDKHSTRTQPYCNDSWGGCNLWGSATTTLDGTGKNVNILPTVIGGKALVLPAAESSLNIYLNTSYYNSLAGASKNQIYLGLYKVGIINSSSANLPAEIAQENATKWRGNIGLISPIDYVKSSLDSGVTSVSASYKNLPNGFPATTNNSYLSKEAYSWWTMSPVSGNQGSSVFYITQYKAISSYWAENGSSVSASQFGIRPVVFLKSDIKLSGDGTSSRPYVIK